MDRRPKRLPAPRPPSLAWALVVALSASASSCRQVVGVEQREPRACVGLEAADEGCGSCLREACCDEVDACLADPSCALALGCWSACPAGDGACLARCEGEGRFGSERAALEACRARSCPASCRPACLAPLGRGTGCDACSSPCCAFADVCARELDCGLLRACLDACTESGCAASCRNRHPVGASLEAAVEACVERACPSADDWSCLGQVSWPTVAPQPFSLAIRFTDLASSKPFTGLTVKSCSVASPSCSPPEFGPVETDEQGFAHLVVTPPALSTHGWQGFLEVDGGEIFPSIVYLQPPLTGPASIDFLAVSRSSLESLAAPSALDPGRGHLLMKAFSCGAPPPDGVVFSVSGRDERSLELYTTAQGVADRNAHETSAAGQAGAAFVNLLPGLLHASSRRRNVCQDIGSTDVWVKPGRATLVPMVPTPSPP